MGAFVLSAAEKLSLGGLLATRRTWKRVASVAKKLGVRDVYAQSLKAMHAGDRVPLWECRAARDLLLAVEREQKLEAGLCERIGCAESQHSGWTLCVCHLLEVLYGGAR